ncbi:MAG: acyl-CoA reductase [Candidatus Binatia bacterium]
MAEYEIPMIIRGKAIRDHLVTYPVRRAGMTFRTPDMRHYVDQMILRDASGMADLYDISSSEIVDFLVELASWLSPEKNEHIKLALEINLQANVQSRDILFQIYNSSCKSMTRASMLDSLEKSIGLSVLDGWERRQLEDREVLVRAIGSRTVSLNPGNSPAAAVGGIMQSALLRCDTIVKFPANDPYTATAIALTMIEMAPDHPITKHYSVAYWKGGDREVEEKLYQPANLEKIIAWGGWASMRQVRSYLVPGIDLVALDPKTSASLIGREAFASRDTMVYAANQLAKDVGMFNQAFCSSSRVAFVESGTDAAGLAQLCQLGELVYAAVQELPLQVSSVCPDFSPALRQDIEGIRNDTRFRVIGVKDSEGGVIVSQVSKPVDFKDLLNFRVVNLVPVDRIEQALQWITMDTQTIGIYPEPLKERLRDRCAMHGGQRLTTLGCSPFEGGGAPHDGMEVYRRIARWVTIEYFDADTVQRGAGMVCQS